MRATEILQLKSLPWLCSILLGRVRRRLHAPLFSALGLWLAFGRIERDSEDRVADEFFVRKVPGTSPLIRTEGDWLRSCVMEVQKPDHSLASPTSDDNRAGT